MTGKATPPFTILRVVDTREFIEIGDRWFPVAGSGDPRECDRCGRTHEIHAHVTDVDGHPAVVGTGCMGLASNEARKHAGRATTAAKKAARHAAAVKAHERLAEAKATVAAMTMPTYTVRPSAILRNADGSPADEWVVDDARVVVRRDADHAERLACLTDCWRRNRLAEQLDVDLSGLWRLENLAANAVLEGGV